MRHTQEIAQKIGIKVPEVYLPNPKIDLQKWAVIACDQFTSEPDYWRKVETIVGDAPSTYHMILPEVFLGTPEEPKRIDKAHQVMEDYMQSGVFGQLNNFIYVLREVDGCVRRGLMVCLDLEQYDYNKGAQTLIRATEGTILDRLPPRISIRAQAPLECPHILVLFDDPKETVFSPLDEQLQLLEKVYDFDLMLGSGHLTGYAINDEAVQNHVLKALSDLIDPETFANKNNLKAGRFQPLLFAMGDGNHSLATAKAVWEKTKSSVGMDHPARYALVEIENIHDSALTFEPIHRLLFNLNANILSAIQDFWGKKSIVRRLDSLQEMVDVVDKAEEAWHQVGLVCSDGNYLVDIHDPADNLPVGSLQKFLDAFLAEGNAEKIDYVHGTEVLFEKGVLAGNAGFYVPGMDKSDLFKSVILDGALPRKTFSMGEARHKRFYLECRRIQA